MSDLAKARCVVLLTFDFDAESAQVRKTPNLPVSLSKGQFAPRVGIRRVLDMLDTYGIRATFFTPAWTARQYQQETREIARRGHEVAGHGYLHENFSELSDDEEWKVHQKSVDILEEVLGRRPVGFRAPYWEWSTRTLPYLRRFGFMYDSSLMNDDKPYLIRSEGETAGIYELPVEWFLDDWELFEKQRQNPSAVLDTWRSEFEAVYDLEVGYFMLTMHPECIGRAYRMAVLGQLIDCISKKEGIIFARCDEFVDYLGKSLSKQRR